MGFTFLSTPSARRATFEECDTFSGMKDFYPRPPRGGRQDEQGRIYHAYTISIHALREEGDTTVCVVSHDPFIFLSTPSARRATPPE